MKNTKKALNKGFSLVEMLVVIAVIGIIAAIAVPNIGKINDKAKTATNKRNAQTVASVFSTALAAGIDFSTGAADLDACIDNCINGATVSDTQSAFYNEWFGCPGLPLSSDTDTDDAAAFAGMKGFLNFANGHLTYTGAN